MNDIQKKPIIAVTYGEAAGIGPEVLVKALTQTGLRKACRPLIVGDMRVIQRAQEYFKTNIHLKLITDLKQSQWSNDVILVLDQKNLSLSDFEDGKPNASTGRAMIEATRTAVQLMINGYVQGAVGGPHSKKAAEDAGFHFEGYPAFVAEMTHSQYPFLMLVADNLRVANVTLHVSLRKAVDQVKEKLVFECIKATYEGVQKMGIKDPKIAVAGLNPHAGEDRLFGDEDEDEIKPAVLTAQSFGINVVGPLPADSLFYGSEDGKYDAYVAMYHDQAHLPVKTLAFKRAAAVVIGVPVNYATVGHGCALDIAWKGEADPNVLAYTIELISKRAVVSVGQNQK